MAGGLLDGRDQGGWLLALGSAHEVLCGDEQELVRSADQVLMCGSHQPYIP